MRPGADCPDRARDLAGPHAPGGRPGLRLMRGGDAAGVADYLAALPASAVAAAHLAVAAAAGGRVALGLPWSGADTLARPGLVSAGADGAGRLARSLQPAAGQPASVSHRAVDPL